MTSINNRLGVYLLIGLVKLSLVPFIICLCVLLFAELAENIFSELILVILTREQHEKEQTGKSGNAVSLFFGFRSFGSIIGLFFGGRLLELYGKQFCFLLGILSPAFVLLAICLYKEHPIPDHYKTKKNFWRDFNQLKNLFTK